MKVTKIQVLAISDGDGAPSAIVYSDGRTHTFLECRRFGIDGLQGLLEELVAGRDNGKNDEKA